MSQLEQIKKQHQKGHVKKAIEGYLAYISKKPNDDDAHFALALAYKDIKNFEQALKAADEAVKLAPSAERYHQFKGQMHMALGQSDAALKAFRTSLKHNPNLYFSYLALGDIYLHREQFQQAEEQYRLAQRVHQEAPPAAVKLARLMLLTSRSEEAGSVLQAAALHHPDDPEIKLYQGVVSLENGELAFAEMHFKKLLEDHPNFSLAKAFLAISLINHDQKQAAKMLNELIESKHQSPELMAATAMLSFKQKHFQEAADYLIHVCRSSLAYPGWFITLCQTLVALNRLKEAQQVLERLLQRGNNDRAHVMMAMIDVRQDNLDQAIDRLQAIDTDSPHYMAALKQKMQAHHQAQQWSQALAVADEILQDRADNHEAAVVKAYALMHLDKKQQALTVLETALSHDYPENMTNDLHLYAGLLCDDMGDYDTAWTHFSAQQQTQPQTVSLLDQKDEKTVQKWPSAETNEQPVFVMSDTVSGHEAFIRRLRHHGIATLTDRYQRNTRQDLFFQHWRFEDIAALDESRCHLLRKKYQQHLKRRHQTGTFADFIPMTALNMVLIKKVFPAAAVIVLDRNMPDRHLHQAVFGNGRYSTTDFGRLKNQLIAMNPNIALLDIDALLTNDATVLDTLGRLFNTDFIPWQAPQRAPMERLMLPKNHWKAYRQFLQPATS